MFLRVLKLTSAASSLKTPRATTIFSVFSLQKQTFSINRRFHLEANMTMRLMRDDLKSIFTYCLNNVLPGPLVENVMRRENNFLFINGTKYELKHNLYIVGFGKAVLGMASEVVQLVQDHLQSGILSIPAGIQNLNTSYNINMIKSLHINVYEGAVNNLPDKKSLEAAINIRDLTKSLDAEAILLVLISGGGSALLPLPRVPVSLEEKTQVIQMLASSGANIMELNTVRKKLSGLKGGRLAQIAAPAQIVSLILSDVIGDPLDVIASGPTVPNCDSICAAANIIKKYNLTDKIALNVKMILNDDNAEIFEHVPKVDNVIIGNNKMALTAAADEARRLGYFPVILTDSIQGDVSDVCFFYAVVIRLFCQYLCGKLDAQEFMIKLSNQVSLPTVCQNLWLQVQDITSSKEAVNSMKGVCFVAGGEPTVVVRGKGKGGRNQELSLLLAIELHAMQQELSGTEVVFLSAGTDGIDGPTQVAGAFSYAAIIEEALGKGLKVEDYLSSNDSFTFYSQINNGNDLIVTGHTGTNVMDVHLIAFKKDI